MPNHVTTLCKITGPKSALKKFSDAHLVARADPPEEGEALLKSAERRLDFNTIIPMPEVIKGTQSSSDAEQALFALHGLAKRHWGDPALVPVNEAEFIPRYGHLRDAKVATRAELMEHLKKTRPQALVEGEKIYKAYQELPRLVRVVQS